MNSNQLNIVEINNIAKLVSNYEKTIELKDYWMKRYSDLLASDLFLVSEKTLSFINRSDVVGSPVTPFGFLQVDKFVVSSGVDEILLQNTLETAIRFLDSCLDTINFEPDIKTVVNGYRKIGVDIAGFDKYVELLGSDNELEEIDYIGNLTSNVCYRVSESLAEEKGTCVNWSRINKVVKLKPFEYWFNVESGEIKSSLELLEVISEDKITESSWEIYPRRNSHILIYPKTPEWKIWSDRDELTSPKNQPEPTMVNVPVTIEAQESDSNSKTAETLDIMKNIDIAKTIENETNPETQIEGNEEIEETTIELVKDIPAVDFENNSNDKKNKETVKEINLEEKDSNKNFGFGFDPASILNQVIDKVYIRDKQKLESQNKNKADSKDPSTLQQLTKLGDFGSGDSVINIDDESQPNQFDSNTTDSQFQPGNIVKIINPTLSQFNQLSQIQKTIINPETKDELYILKDLNNTTFSQSDLELVKVSEINESKSDSNYNVTLNLILVSQNLKTVYLDSNQKIIKYSKPQSEINEQEFIHFISQEYGQNINNLSLLANQYKAGIVDSLYYSICFTPSSELIAVEVSSLSNSQKSSVNLVINEILQLQNTARSQANKMLESVLAVEMQTQKSDIEDRLRLSYESKLKEQEQYYQNLIKTKFVAKDVVDARVKNEVAQSNDKNQNGSIIKFGNTPTVSEKPTLNLGSKEIIGGNSEYSNAVNSTTQSPNSNLSYLNKLKNLQKFAQKK
jgi:hypothetical protein